MSCNEAHYVEIWGDGLEPFCRSYLKLALCNHFFLSSALCGSNSPSVYCYKMKICNSLNMIETVAITTSPNRVNLHCSVFIVKDRVVSQLSWLLKELSLKEINALKTIVFYCSISSCSSLYHLFDFTLKDDGYLPRGDINVNTVLFRMYCVNITDYKLNKRLLESFSKRDRDCCALLTKCLCNCDCGTVASKNVWMTTVWLQSNIRPLLTMTSL